MSGGTAKAELRFFEHGETDTLAQLVFDLAAQLHVERQRRLALETLLVRSGAVSETALEALVGDDAFLARSRDVLDRSLARLMRIVAEDGDRQGPLRAEDPAVAQSAKENR
ncbi:MAG: hypothetical protein RLO50_22655 [Azospirillaceae bacterium]